jgi:hypothetical protein
VPARPELPEAHADYGQRFAPEQAVRGLHLHTLHPIEAYFAFWEPGERQLDDARRVLDWVVKNRGNEVQWVALGDVQEDPVVGAAWHDHTAAIVQAAHVRGLGVGLGIQLFGVSNLQAAWDLLDVQGDPDPRATIAARLAQITDLGLDRVSLSFGEFFSADPAAFVAMVDLAYEVLQEQAPGTELVTTIHVGNKPDQRVTYMGEELQYYFLVKFANPAIVPWVHTVMYYNLFEDAGGAYEHDEFDEHRAFILAKLAAGERVAYHPESAYWVAFDDSVPAYFPLYLRSRALDMQMLPGLEEHVLFSTGWEWGYWQNDVITLRMGYRMGAGYREHLDTLLGADLGARIEALAELQHQHLLVGRLAAYLAGRDAYIDAGKEIGVVSQPDRPSFAEVAALAPAERAAFAGAVLAGLDALADGTAATAPTGPTDDPFVAEVIDGFAVTEARTRYIAALYRAAVAHGDGDAAAAEAAIADAEMWLAVGEAVVARRHAALHYPDAARLLKEGPNATIYPFGYLHQADELCYWRRELTEVQNLVRGEDATVSACVF